MSRIVALLFVVLALISCPTRTLSWLGSSSSSSPLLAHNNYYYCATTHSCAIPRRQQGSRLSRRPAAAPAAALRRILASASDDCSNSSSADDEEEDDLTKEELALRFAEVLRHYSATGEMTERDVCEAMLRTRLPDLRLNRCRVGPSTLGAGAGRGLFASRDIRCGELVTLFPGDALLLWNASRGVGDFGEGGVGVLFGRHVVGEDRDPDRVASDLARRYEVKISDSRSLVADPRRIDDAAYLGHIMNDGAALLLREDESGNCAAAARTRYSRLSHERHNAAFFVSEGCHLAALATRDIAGGEEIFVSYGEGYWLSRIQQGSVHEEEAAAAARIAPMATTKTKGTTSRTKGGRRGGGGPGRGFSSSSSSAQSSS
jgi:SET domain